MSVGVKCGSVFGLSEPGCCRKWKSARKLRCWRQVGHGSKGHSGRWSCF